MLIEIKRQSVNHHEQRHRITKTITDRRRRRRIVKDAAADEDEDEDEEVDEWFVVNEKQFHEY